MQNEWRRDRPDLGAAVVGPGLARSQVRAGPPGRQGKPAMSGPKDL